MNRRVDFYSLLILSAFLFLPAACSDRSNDFRSDFAEGLERVWIGPEYFANRLADWRLADGRLECLEARPEFPLRTVHLLTHTLSPTPESFVITVETGPLALGGEANAEAWTGFLIGAGGDHVDYRLTAMVHHRPAEDGGLLAVVNGQGVAAFRDNSGGTPVGDIWSVRGALRAGEVPEIEASTQVTEVPSDSKLNSVALELRGQSAVDGYRLTLTARDLKSGREISRAVLEGVSPEQVDGGVALVSHLAPTGAERGFWFDDWSVSGPKVAHRENRTFGPILSAQYTVSGGVLKMTAQMPPLGRQDPRTASLQISGEDGSWKTVAESARLEDSHTVPFRVEEWDSSRETSYRIVYEMAVGAGSSRESTFEGVILAEPVDQETLTVAAFTGHKNYTGGLKWNSNGIWFPHNEVVSAIDFHEPDLLFFSGDQVYEGDLTPAIYSPVEDALLDYLYKWYRWCWAFGSLTARVPTVTIPDDHDVYHGNIWGAGGRKAEAGDGLTAQDSGGYKMPPRFVNAVHATQTSHLPDPYDSAPVEQGISVYYTDLRWGGVSFAILGDRQWKSSPTVAVPEGKYVNGWSQNPRFDAARQADVSGAVLLGKRQLDFLEQWASDWSDGIWMKTVLSQTIFANVATLPEGATSGSVLPSLPTPAPGEYPPGYSQAADADSNAWPQTGRNRALSAIRKGFALHIAGDQHLASTVQYGIDDWADAGYALCVPSIGNTWPRRWFPSTPGRNRSPDSLPYSGDFRDGFGNLMTVFAVANPQRSGHEPANLHDRSPGYGIVRLNRTSREIELEVWPRWSDPSAPDAQQYPGWPIRLEQEQNYGRKAFGFLPTLGIEGLENAVVQLVEERSGDIVYTLRIRGSEFRPKVFQRGLYTLRIGEPGLEMKSIRGLSIATAGQDPLVVKFE